MKKNTLVMITIRKILTLTLIVMAHTLFGQIVTEPTKVPIDQTLGKGSAMNNFSVATTSDLKGTMKQVKTIGQRDSILSSMRDVGMLCFVEDSGKMYQLLGGIANGDWQIFVTDSTGAVPTIPGGYPSTTLRRNVAGTAWVSDSAIYNNGALVGLKYGRLQIDTTTVTSDSLNVLYNREGKLYWGGTDLTRRSGGSGLPDGDLNATLRNSTNNDSVWAASNALTNNDTTIGFATGRLQISNSTFPVSDSMSNLLYNLDGKLYWKSTRLDTLGGGGSTTFDGDRTVTRTGVAQVNVVSEGATVADIKDFLNAYFFPAVVPGLFISLAINNQDLNFGAVCEYGRSDLAATITWKVTKHTYGISTITVDGVSITVSDSINENSDPDGSTQTVTAQAKTIGANGVPPQNASMNIIDTHTNPFSANSNTLSWAHRYYKGASTVAPATMKTNLASTSPYDMIEFSSTVSTSKGNGSGTYNCSGGKYIYYLYPKQGGTGIVSGGFAAVSSVTVGGFAFSDWTCESITIKDHFNVSRDYWLFYINGIQGGSAIAVVIN